MKESNKKFRIVDALFIVMMIAPLVVAMAIKVLTTPAAEDGISITGARILFTVPMPIQDLIISEAQVNAWLILITIFGFCLFITHGLKEDKRDWRQMAAEWIVEKLDDLVQNSMEDVFHATYAPFIGTILAISACSSLMSLVGVFPPTADVNVIAGWSILVFALITKNKLKGGVGNYAKGFLEPIPVMLPMNILSEFATPISMTFRHFGNVMSGTVIATLIAWALQNLSHLVLGWLPGFLGDIPFLQVGLPAILSIYFDVFSGCIQAYIFAMLTMLNISGAYPAEAIEKRLAKREARRARAA
ncbi:MAG: F0F1 ATP synthase subunit A [Clostridiales bacterium]|nr:F0F1 ATP synthase subunit A [Clostridiales bacterium]